MLSTGSTVVSDRKKLRIIIATVTSLGHNPQELILSTKGTRQARTSDRSQLAAEFKTTFVSDTPLTVHWDRKIFPAELRWYAGGSAGYHRLRG